MSLKKEEAAATAVASAPSVMAAGVMKTSLNEFCIRVSQSVTRPELISAFEYTERAARRLSDTDEAYRARFAAFVNKPV